MIVGKALKMAEMMNIPVLGLVENMSYFECPDCKSRHNIFGESKIDAVAAQHGIKNVAKLPMSPAVATLCDNGIIELFEGDWLEDCADVIENIK